MSKLTMMVCPHDTVHEPERWYRLEQYLMARLGLEIQFELSLDAADFSESVTRSQIVYTNPSDRIKHLVGLGYVSVARPRDLYDEVVFVANSEIATPSLASLHGAAIATVTSLMPTSLALSVLEREGIQPGSLVHKDSWQSVISAVWNKEAEFGFVYKDTYDSLSEHGKGLVQMFAASDEKQAYHTLEISPALADQKAAIGQVLFAMHENAEGQAILAALNVGQWLPIAPEELARMGKLMQMVAA